MSFSTVRARIDVTDIGLKSPGPATCETFGMGGMYAVFQASGTVRCCIEKFIFVALPVPEILGGTLKILGVR